MTTSDRLLSLNGDHLESICPELAAVVEAAEKLEREIGPTRWLHDALASLAAKLGEEQA